MTRLKEERHSYHLDIVDYLGEPSASVHTLKDIGRYQPARGVADSLLSKTTRDYDSLRVGALSASQEGETVTVHATARYKPEDPGVYETDRWDYTETDPIPLCTLQECSELEAGLAIHWLPALNDHGSGFANYRDTATKTISLRERILAAYFPNLAAVADDLRAYLSNAGAAAKLDAQLKFTDNLIDQIVYRLYGLTEEEVAVVVEGAIGAR